MTYLPFRYKFSGLFLLIFTYLGNNFYLFATDQAHKPQSLIEQKKKQ